MKAAKERIINIRPIEISKIQKQHDFNSSHKIPFSDLIKKGLIKPGDRIFNIKDNIRAVIFQMVTLNLKRRRLYS